MSFSWFSAYITLLVSLDIENLGDEFGQSGDRILFIHITDTISTGPTAPGFIHF